MMHDPSFIDSRYQVLRTIGSGGMGVVYLVVDTRRGNQIMALKMMRNVEDPTAIESFRSEFRAIRGVIHPHIPEVYDFGTLPESQGGYYFTTEFVDGKPLDQLAREWTPDQLRSTLVNLCRALAFLHSRGLLHRDIKPENVLGRLGLQGEFTLLKLVDFGLASLHHEESEETGGTLEYMAPELFKSRQSSVASDLYALGVLLYRLATGRLPFEGEDAVALAKLREQREAPHPLRFKPDLPIGLADVIASLIQPKAEDRPQSARHVIAMLNERDGTTFDYECQETRIAYISSSGSVTNVEIRNELAEQRLALKRGEQPRNLLIRARAGLGRTRMLKEFAVELTLAGLKACVAAKPHELPPKSNFPNVLLIPSVESMPGDKLESLIDAKEGRNCWWIVAGEFTTGVPEMFREFAPCTLKPLDEAGIGRFVAATFPDNSFPGEFANRLLSQTLGYPSAIEAALEELLNHDQLRIGLFGWELQPGQLRLSVHRHVAEVIRDTLGSLSDELRSLLRVLAISPMPVPFSVAWSALGLNSQAQRESALVETEQLGWIARRDSALEISLDVVKSQLHERFSEGEKRSLHEQLFAYWELAVNEEPDTRQRAMLFHDFQSGVFKTPPEQAQSLIEQLLFQGRTTWVRPLLEGCLRNAPDSHRKVARICYSRLEYMEGDFSKATESLSEIVEHGEAKVTRDNVMLVARYATMLEKLGETERAEEILNRCYALQEGLTAEAAGSVYGMLAWIAFKRGDGERARALAEEGLVRIPVHAEDAGFALLLNTVATLAFYRGDNDVARTYWQRCLEVFEALGDKKGVSNMYNNLGVLAAQAGDRLRARTLWERCAAISKEIGDVNRLAGIYNNLGIDSLETGALREAEDFYLKSLALFRKMNNPREQVEIIGNLGELAYQRADYPRAMAYLKDAVQLAESIGDQESQIEPLVYLGKLLLALEALEEAEATLNNARELAASLGSRKSEGQSWEALAGLFSRQGDSERACGAVNRAQELLADEADPLALLHLHLTRCKIAAESGHTEEIQQALDAARKVADIKWDPYTAARTQTIAALYGGEKLDASQWQVALRKISVYPNLSWQFHWATARRLAAIGQPRQALEEFGRGVSVLKAIAARLPERIQDRFLQAPQVLRFKEEAIALRTAMQGAK